MDLIAEQMEGQQSAKGIIIEGYPRTMQQVEEYEQAVSIYTCSLYHGAEEVGVGG